MSSLPLKKKTNKKQTNKTNKNKSKNQTNKNKNKKQNKKIIAVTFEFVRDFLHDTHTFFPQRCW